MPNLTILAHIQAHPDHITRVHDALMALIAPTRAEAGCIQYDLHLDTSDPAHFFFFEIWTSREAWQAHMAAPHLVRHAADTQGATLGVTVHEMTQIG